MSSSLTKPIALPHLSRRWTTADTAAAQGDRNDGLRAAREGSDGARVIDQFWRKLASECASDLLRFYGDCMRLRQDQDARLERLRHEHDQEMVGQAAANQRQHDDRLGTLKRELGPDSAPFKQAVARAEDAHKTLRGVRGEVNSRPLRTHFGPFYLVVMLILALAEVPVNRAAFELTFREEPLFSLGLALAVGLVLIFFSHVIGLILRQWPRRNSFGQVAPRLGAMAVILAVVGSGVYFMARMRQAFLRLTAAENDGFAQRLQDALRGGARETVSVITDLPLTLNDWTFIAINVLLFVFGISASFLRHDPHPDYEKAVKEGRRADRALGRLEKRYGDAVAEETSRYEDRKRSLDTQMSELRATIAAVADQSSGILRHCESGRQMAAQTIRTRCGSFQEGFNAAGAPKLLTTMPTNATILAELPTPDIRREP